MERKFMYGYIREEIIKKAKNKIKFLSNILPETCEHDYDVINGFNALIHEYQEMTDALEDLIAIHWLYRRLGKDKVFCNIKTISWESINKIKTSIDVIFNGMVSEDYTQLVEPTGCYNFEQIISEIDYRPEDLYKIHTMCHIMNRINILDSVIMVLYVEMHGTTDMYYKATDATK